MKLWTINRVLRKLGLVLVVSFSRDSGSKRKPTRLWIQRAKTYDARTRNPPPTVKVFCVDQDPKCPKVELCRPEKPTTYQGGTMDLKRLLNEVETATQAIRIRSAEAMAHDLDRYEKEMPPTIRERIRETPGQPDEPVVKSVTKNCPKCEFFMTWWPKSNGWYCGKDFLFIPDRNVGRDPDTP